jgi:serine phosphatase RsbU (regulator of sigma subunit)
VITLSFAEERGFPADERATIETLARVCAQALDRARLFAEAEEARREAQAAATAERDARQAVQRLSDSLQRALLPTLSVKGRGLRVTAYYRAGERRLTLGGDFYDCIELPDSTVALLVGDVSGHGAAAAAVGAGIRAAWRAYALDGLAPHVALERLERVFACERPDDEMFATACSVRLSADRARVEVSLAGHPAPMLVGERVVTPRLVADLPLGTPTMAPRRVHTVATGQAHSLLLYTDGVVEGRSTPRGRQRFGAERLRRAVALRAGALDGAGLASIVRQAERANGGPLADDVALVTLRFATPTPREPRS